MHTTTVGYDVVYGAAVLIQASLTKERGPHFLGYVNTVQVVHPYGSHNKISPFRRARPMLFGDVMTTHIGWLEPLTWTSENYE